MKEPLLHSFITVGGILPFVYCILAFSTLLLLFFLKKKHPESNRLASIKNLIFFFFSISLVLAIHSIIVVKLFDNENLIYYCNMLVSKAYLITTTLLVILMQETGFVEKGKSLVPLILFSYLIVITVADMFFMKVSVKQTTMVFGFVVVALNMLTYLFALVKVLNKSRKSHFFSSKSKIIESVLVISSLLVVNYLYVFYMMSNVKITVMYFIILFLALMHIIIYLRIAMGEPSFISKLDKEEEPYPILPPLGEDYCGYGGNSSMQSRLCLFFEKEKPYLSPDLSISDVAEKIYTNKTYLSRLLNTSMGRGFKEFVNHYRVREAMKIYSRNNNISLAELCKMCGFGNIATFTNAFRLHAGKTPGEWCRSMKNGGDDEKRKNAAY